MKRLLLLLGATIFLFLAFLGATRIANATSLRSGNTLNLTSGQINETIFTGGRTVTIGSEVFGDVFAVGQDITVNGPVHGDVIAAGQTVTVTGKVDGNIRLAGQTVTVGSQVSKNATIAAQSLVLTSGSYVGGDLSIGSTDAVVNGTVGRDAAIRSGTTTLNATVGRNVNAETNSLHLGSHAKVTGNLEYTSKNNLTKDPAATVSGTTTRHQPTSGHSIGRKAIFGFGVGWLIYWFVAILFTALILVLIFPRFFHRATDSAFPRPWKALLVGFIACIVAPLVMAVLAATIIGIPLDALFTLVWVAILFLSGPVFAYYLGRLILRRSQNAILIMLVGAVILGLLYFIPIVNVIALLAALFMGTGALLITGRRQIPRPQYKPVPKS